MDRRLFLTALAGAGAGALALDHKAFAASGPIEATVTRSSAAGVKIVWQAASGSAAIFVADAPYADAKARRQAAAGSGGAADVTAPASPRPYFLVRAGGQDVWTAERLLPLQGGRNFRDLGGYRTTDNKQVRWGKIFRSGVMSGLTPADMDYLSALGINVICDLRAKDERTQDPTPFLKKPGAKVVSFDYDLSSTLEAMARTKTREEAVQAFAASYVSFLDTLTPNFTDMFAKLAAGEAPLALNCSAGKDRTGVGSALILSALGVPRETIAADYGLTQVYTPPSMYAQAISSGAPTPGLTPQMAEALRKLPPEVLQVLMGSPPEVMARALALIDERYGSPVQLLKSKFGVTDAGIARMRQLYLV